MTIINRLQRATRLAGSRSSAIRRCTSRESATGRDALRRDPTLLNGKEPQLQKPKSAFADAPKRSVET
jgi:hypothetical protein